MIKKVAFFAHPTRDLPRAKSFYSEVLGLKVTAEYAEFWLEVETPDGATLALDTFSPKSSDHPTPYLALETDDIEAEVARLREAGTVIAKEIWTNQGEDGRVICKMAIAIDPEGNPLMLHEIAPDRA